MYKGNLFIISGPSGAGKGTICKNIIENENIRLSVSMTTRAPRQGECEGEHYYFVDKEVFDKLIDEDGLMEYAHVFDNFYGTPKKQVLDWMDEGKDVILEIDVQGALKIKENYSEGIFIFVLPPTIAELRKRIEGRGTETREAIDKRLGKAITEIEYIREYDYFIVNEDAQNATETLRNIIEAYHTRLNKDLKEKIIQRYKEEE